MSDNREVINDGGNERETVRLKQPTDGNILKDLEAHVRDVPGNVADRIDRHPTYVSDRINQLEDYGLVENTGRSVYKLTEKGKRYLAGDLETDSTDDPQS